jgi:multicomponent Na+:H+ antiporter subunit A
MVFPRDDPPASREDHRGGELPIDYQGWLACATAGVGFILCLAGWLAGGGAISLPWAPTLNLRLSAALDGLGALYALLATGIGA